MADNLLLRALRGKARTLNLNGKKLQRISGAVGSLTGLSVLQLKNNLLSQLPEEVSALRNLTVLNLGNNCFENIPEQIKYLKSLQILHLFGNRITGIRSSVFDGLENLKFLNLNNNMLEHLPCEIIKLAHLETLSINHNHLKDIPKELCLLQNLRELHLANNVLETLPEELRFLNSLKELRISRNQLTDLPEGLCRLVNLKILDVAGNQICAFPSAETGSLASVQTSCAPALSVLVSIDKHCSVPRGNRKGLAVQMHTVPLTELYCEENPLLQKNPVSAIQQEETLSLKEITARLILRHIQCQDSLLQQQIKQHPEARKILSSRNVCALCGRWFLDMWLECVTFVDIKKKMKTSSNLQLLPVRVLLCSYKCFNQKQSGIFGVAMP